MEQNEQHISEHLSEIDSPSFLGSLLEMEVYSNYESPRSPRSMDNMPFLIPTDEFEFVPFNKNKNSAYRNIHMEPKKTSKPKYLKNQHHKRCSAPQPSNKNLQLTIDTDFSDHSKQQILRIAIMSVGFGRYVFFKSSLHSLIYTSFPLFTVSLSLS